MSTTPNPVPPAPSPTPVPTPTPAPTPTPTPAPTPTPTANYDTPEYRATVGAVSMNALAGYRVGATGAGIGIGIIDSGIDLQSAEFGSRISSASQDVAGNSSIDDEGGHGTAVAFTAAGRRNGTGTHGVAFDATLIVMRADRPGTCAAGSTNDDDSTCKFPTDAITRGVDAARLAGARVINMSLGGSTMPQSLVDAIGRATAVGIVVVIAAGNDGTSNPDPFTQVADNRAVARNQVIIAGSVGSGDTISSFSDRAGTSQDHFLTAVGENVLAPNQNNTVYLWSGTSFAAPQISAAVALLAQAFPNLTGQEIVEILMRTARDAGAAGTDPVYGMGILDLSRAFQPIGTTTVAGLPTAVSQATNAMLSAPMGDARQAELGAVILDSYKRAFAIDLSRTIDRGGPQRLLGGALQSRQRNLSIDAGSMSVSMTLVPRGNGDVAVEQTRLTTLDAQSARAIAGSVTQRLGKTLSFGIGFSQGADTLTAQLTGQSRPAFLVARDDGAGFDQRIRAASAIRLQIGGFGLTGAIENGDVLSWRDPLIHGMTGWQRWGYSRASVAVDRRIGAVSLLASATRFDERDTVLGARFDPGLGATSATTWFVDARLRADWGEGWTMGGAWRQGWTRATIRAGLTGGGRITSRSFAADIGKARLFGRDSIGLRVAQPLRVSSGGLDLALPTSWDYASGSVTAWTTQRLNLAPTGREIDVEARYLISVGAGLIESNLFWRRNPGNLAYWPADYGLALRYHVGF